MPNRRMMNRRRKMQNISTSPSTSGSTSTSISIPTKLLTPAIQANKEVIDKIIKKAVDNTARQIKTKMEKRYVPKDADEIELALKELTINEIRKKQNLPPIKQIKTNERQILFDPKP